MEPTVTSGFGKITPGIAQLMVLLLIVGIVSTLGHWQISKVDVRPVMKRITLITTYLLKSQFAGRTKS